MVDAAFIAENESKAAKLFAARRLRSEKFSQCGWGTCTEDSETEFFHSDSEESELDFTDTDVPEYQEPCIRSNTPSAPAQKINSEGKGAKLFRKRQERMQSYTKVSNGRATGLPTGQLNDRQRCGYAAKTKYDIMNFEKEQQEKAMAAAAAAQPKQDIRKDKDFIDFSMPPPKKITLPKVEIKKDFGVLPFQYMRPSQYNGDQDLTARPNSACGRFSSLDNRAMTPNGTTQRPWNVVVASGPQLFKKVKPPGAKVAAQNVKQVKDLPKQSTDFGSQMFDINSANYRRINFKQPKKNAPKDRSRLPKAQNVTALGFKKPLEGKINVTDRRMSVKDLLVTGQDYEPVQVPRSRPPPRSQSASRAGNRRPESRALIHDSQTSQHLQFVHDREEVCPSRAQLEPSDTPYNKFHPRRIVQANANVWTPQRA